MLVRHLVNDGCANRENDREQYGRRGGPPALVRARRNVTIDVNRVLLLHADLQVMAVVA